jgi:hypothetical protein
MVIIGSFMLTNYVAYVVPNHRSAEFLVFCVLALSFRHHHAKRSGLATRPSTPDDCVELEGVPANTMSQEKSKC